MLIPVDQKKKLHKSTAKKITYWGLKKYNSRDTDLVKPKECFREERVRGL